jgi:PAS domain S-box-containing protein
MDSDCRLIFDHLPGIYVILKPDPPDFTIMDYNKALVHAKMSPEPVRGKKLFEVFTDDINNPEATGVTNLSASLMMVIKTKKPHRMALQRYDLLNPQTNQFEEKYWSPENIPVLDAEDNIKYIIHAVEEVTDKVLLQKEGEKAQHELTYLHKVQFNILESIEDAFISTNKNWIVKYWNKQAEIIFKVDRKKALGRYLWDIIKIEGDGKLYEGFQKAMESNKPAHFEEYYSPMDIWLQANAYPSVDGLSAVLVNITEKKKTEEEIRKNEQRFRALIENISDGLAVISPTGIIKELSNSAQKILGYDFKYFKGQSYKHLFFPVDLPGVEQAFKNTLDIENIRDFYAHFGISAYPTEHYNTAGATVQFRFIRHGGGIRWLEGTFHNLLHEETIRAVVFTFRDITTRRMQEQQLQASEEKYRYLFQNNPAAIIIWTLEDYWIREVNEAACLQYGYTRNDFLSRTFLDLKPADQQSGAPDPELASKFENTLEQGIWQHKTKGDNIIYMDFSFHRIIYSGMNAVLTLGTNVTDKILLQKKLEEERERKQKEITEAAITAQENERAELGRELHDNISQVLTTARMYIEHSLNKKEKQVELLQYSREYISKAVGEIRELSHRLMPPSLIDVSLKQNLEELFLHLKYLSEYKFKFEFLLPQEKNICKDLKLAIFRIVQEGLNNVFRHARAAEVVVRVEQKQDLLEVCIEDNGIGFDPQRKTFGVGLRNITSRANLFGGQIELNSQPGKGTNLKIVFPVDNA